MAQKVYDRERTLTARVAALGQSYHLSGLALVMVAAALWATVGVASEMVPHELSVPDEVYGFARTIIAGPAILALAFITGGASNTIPKRGSMPGFLTFGICCAVFQICLFRSFGLIGVTVTVFLTVCLPPVLAMALAIWRRSERVSSYTVAALGFATFGLMTFIGNDLTQNNLSAVVGLILSVAASVAFVLMTQAARALAVDHTPMLVSGLGLTITALILAPIAFLLSPVDWHVLHGAVADWRSFSMLLYIGLGPTALAYICYCGGMARCRSALTGLVASMIEPAVAAGLAFLFLGETLTLWRTMGCLVMMFAMITLWFGEKKTLTASTAQAV
jgi:drug/metabolite transporter, DME family